MYLKRSLLKVFKCFISNSTRDFSLGSLGNFHSHRLYKKGKHGFLQKFFSERITRSFPGKNS